MAVRFTLFFSTTLLLYIFKRLDFEQGVRFQLESDIASMKKVRRGEM